MLIENIKRCVRPVFLLLTGFTIRALIAIEGIHGTDIIAHVKGVESVILSGSPYCSATYNYPPLYAYIQLLGITIFGWNILGYKFMAILFDSMLSILVYFLLRGLSVREREALITQALWSFNPLAIIASAWYGLFDSVAIFFGSLSILFVIKHKTVMSAILLSLGVLTKVFPIVFLPLNIITLARKNLTDAIRYLGIVIILVASIEVIASYRCLDKAVKNQLTFHIERRDKGLSLIPQYSYSGVISVLLAIALILIIALKTYGKEEDKCYTLSSMAVILTIILNPFVYPHYMLWFMPLLMISYALLFHKKASMFNITSVLTLSSIGVCYWKFYKDPNIVPMLSYIFNAVTLIALIILVIALIKKATLSYNSKDIKFRKGPTLNDRYK